MNDLLSQLLAQATEGGNGEAIPPAPGGGESTTTTQNGAPPAGDQTVPPPKNPLTQMLFPLILMLLVLYFFIFRGPRKRQQQQQQMLNAIQKNTRVRTIGGIIGTVVDVRDEEVVIKIDEASNTKMRVSRNAIGKVYSDDDKTPIKKN